MTTRQVPSSSTSNWPQQYQPIGTPVSNDRTTSNGDTANFKRINQKNHLWLLLIDRYHKRVNCLNNTNNTMTSSVPVIPVTTVDTDQPTENNLLDDQLRPVSGFLAEKPTEFDPFTESPKNDLHKKVRNLLDLKSNVTPYSWQLESPLADRSDKYLNHEIHDHFMQYDLEKNHCIKCGFQSKLEQF